MFRLFSAIETARASPPTTVRTFGVDAARFIENGGVGFVEAFRRAVLGDIVGALGITLSIRLGFVSLGVDGRWTVESALPGKSVVDSIPPLSFL